MAARQRARTRGRLGEGFLNAAREGLDLFSFDIYTNGGGTKLITIFRKASAPVEIGSDDEFRIVLTRRLISG